MLVLLPPSEGKTAPRRGRPLQLEALSFPELTPTREQVLDSLVRLAQRQPDQAQRVLGLSGAQHHEVVRDAGLLSAPAAPAGEIYSGVLYEALGLATLSAAARRRARATVVVSSALFGAVRISDRIPPYRLSAGTTLPGVGGLTRLWRRPLADVMTAAAHRGLVVDLRSGGYAAMWTPNPDVARRTVAVRVLHERPDGSRSVVSHFNKATKGRLLRSLLEAGPLPGDPSALAHACVGLGYPVELVDADGTAKPHRMDVVVTEV